MTVVDVWGLDPAARELVGVSAPVGDTVTTDQLADLLDLTPTRVQTLVRQGIIPQTSRGRYDRRDAVRAYCADMRKRAAGRGTGDPELVEHKRRLVREQADREGIRNATARSELVSASEVEARWTSILTEVRSAALALPARLHAAMPQLTAADVQTIDRAVRDMLGSLAMLEAIERNARRALIPPPKLSLSEWAEAHLRLPAGVSATPGRVRLWEFQKAIADSIGDPAVPRVSVLKSVRTGYSTLLVAAVGSYVSNDPAPIIALVPTEADARTFMVHTVEPIAEATPALSGLFADGDRDTILSKRFPGGSLKVIAAKAPRNLRAHTAKVLLADEIDGMEISAEGSPVLLAEKRTLSFADRKIVVGSTPTVAETSLITRAYEASDRRIFECRCPECGDHHEVLWKDIRWEPDEPETAAWACPGCGSIVEERHKPEMVANGRWRATRPEVKNHHGYRLNALISLMPNASWSQLAREFLQAKDDPDSLKVFVNTLLAEPWRESADHLEEDELASRVEPFGLDNLPPEILFISAGTDVQDDRLETVYMGHSRDSLFALAYETTWGRPDDPKTWVDYDDAIRRRWAHPRGGTIGVDAAAIDAGDGEWMDTVMAFARPRFNRRVVALKGVSGNRPLFVASQTRGSRLFICGVDGAKATLFAKVKARGIHFSDTLPPRFFDEFTSERRILRYSRGVPVKIWERVPGKRAEALDATAYALAARVLISANPDRREDELATAAAPAKRPTVVRSAWLDR